ncbi:MAG: HEAT repeat domain-containing protein, partial [Candidatus Latescibacterota bacterium]
LCQSQWAWMGGQTDGRAAVDDPQLLYDHLQSPSEYQRLEAAYALASQGADAVPYLVKALRAEAAHKQERNLERAHTNPSQLDALFALSAAGAPALAPLENLLVDTDWPLRAAAADALGDMGRVAVGAVPLLERALSDSAVWVRRNATEALGHMGPDGSEAVPALSERLTDPDITVRHNAALALAKIGPSAESAAGALQAAQEDEDLYVRENARIALSRIEA